MPFKNQLPSKLGFFAFFCVLAHCPPCHATKVREQPKSVVSDDHARSLGPGAEDFLVSKLADLSHKKNYEGIVLQLERIVRLDKDDPKTTKALIAFVEKQVRQEEVPPSTLYAIEGALRILGFRGGKEGVEYLGTWLREKKNVSAHLPASKPSFTTHRIKRAAIRALGLSGRDEGMQLLEGVREKLLEENEGAIYGRDFIEAVKDRDEVKAKGLESALRRRKRR